MYMFLICNMRRLHMHPLNYCMSAFCFVTTFFLAMLLEHSVSHSSVG